MKKTSLILIFYFCAFFTLLAQKIEIDPSGYKYIHHIKNNGRKPQVGEYPYFHIYFRNGDNLITSTHERGGLAQYKMPEISNDSMGVIPIVAGLRLMSIGDSLTVFMPIDTIKNLPEELKGVKELAYDLKLATIKTEEEFKADEAAKEQELAVKIEEGKKRAAEIDIETKKMIKKFKKKKISGLIKTKSGLSYIITQPGTGAKIETGLNVSVQYYGAFMNGEGFDDSFSRGMEPFTFEVGIGSVIPGWEEGLTYFNEGSKGYLFIPSKLGYGEQETGPIKSNSDLVFYIEVEKVRK